MEARVSGRAYGSHAATSGLGLFQDAHPKCQRCNNRRSKEAHHELHKGHPARYDWPFMRALCTPCHIEVHQQMRVLVTITLAK